MTTTPLTPRRCSRNTAPSRPTRSTPGGPASFPASPWLCSMFGAGPGRDAEWLAKMGHEVVAVEPARALRELAQGQTSPDITWMDDSLPDLHAVRALNRRFGLILVSGVWFHLEPLAQDAALATAAALLQPQGIFVITLRAEAFKDGRVHHPINPWKLIADARQMHLRLLQAVAEDDYGRPVLWTCLTFRKQGAD